ncbi:unnamed protein product [Periconia digitata]|uniref:Uncharacterized protein n=1 Tax=Periconia digitata TaxID=1303443 RepID=A0A9W4UDJ3_9PLEO|nr:unnamed protein product [Periconia digitata]
MTTTMTAIWLPASTREAGAAVVAVRKKNTASADFYTQLSILFGVAYDARSCPHFYAACTLNLIFARDSPACPCRRIACSDAPLPVVPFATLSVNHFPSTPTCTLLVVVSILDLPFSSLVTGPAQEMAPPTSRHPPPMIAQLSGFLPRPCP